MRLPFVSLGAGRAQVEVERTEVLRLVAELNDLRAVAEQDAIAAREREGALKSLLASETEVRRLATTNHTGMTSAPFVSFSLGEARRVEFLSQA